MKPTQRRRLIVTSSIVLAAGVGVVLCLFFGAAVPVVIVAILLVALVAYAVVNIPARHRVHSWGQVEQAVDHRLGLFGRSYPEESVGPAQARKVGRNAPCPCGSGQKFKRCCAVN